jgi:PAS domain S-box-containing protein
VKSGARKEINHLSFGNFLVKDFYSLRLLFLDYSVWFMAKNEGFRRFGSVLVGEVPWGTHLCQFYENKEDLIDILVPYFAEGLRNNEFCMWVTSPPLEAEEARAALSKVLPNLDEYFGKGQIEIISYDNWYLLGGKFDLKIVLQGLVQKEKDAIQRGFDGLRVTGNTFWIEQNLWGKFVDYEETVNAVIGKHKMIALCTYCLKNCSGTDVVDVERNHVGTLIQRGQKWSLVEDVVIRKQADEALRKSEEEYSSLFANMIDGFAYCQMIFDEKGKPVDFVCLQINDAFEKITGLKREAVIGKKVTVAIPGTEKVNPELLEIYGRVALSCKEEKFEIFFKPLRKWFSISVYCPQKGYFVAVFEDTTERKQTQNKLEKYANQMERLAEERAKKLNDAERLAAIGATARMVGHDIRNPLQAITSDVYLAKTELASTPESKERKNALESLQEIEKNIEYIDKIVADLQDFARPLNPHAEETDLKLIIDELLAKKGLPENVKASVKVETEAKKVVADSAYINRIMYNLVNNAVQAMPKGGKLAIHAYKEANDVVITVKDTGVGIPEGVKNKLFTPMFTTKSKGQGFGLPVVKRMTEALGGTVTFESQEGKGTTFIMRLPPPELNGKWTFKGT